MVTRMRSLLLAVNASTSRRGTVGTGAVNRKPATPMGATWWVCAL